MNLGDAIKILQALAKDGKAGAEVSTASGGPAKNAGIRDFAVTVAGPDPATKMPDGGYVMGVGMSRSDLEHMRDQIDDLLRDEILSMQQRKRRARAKRRR